MSQENVELVRRSSLLKGFLVAANSRAEGYGE